MTPGRARQQGMAVVSALIVVAIVAALTSGLFLRQTSAIRQVENEQARIQARWLLLGGIDWARLILGENARREATVRRDQLWSTPVLDTRIEGGDDERAAVFSGSIQDEQGKYNLYNLAERGVVDETQLDVLARLLAALGLPDTLAPRLAEHVALTQGRAPAAPQAPGETPATSAGGARAPQPRGIEDLAALLQVDQAGARAMRRTMTLLPAASLVNVNTAEPEVIAALVPGLSLAQARAVTGERDRGRWFNDSGDFTNRLSTGDPPLQVPPVTTTSEWFLATGTVAYQRARVSMQALVSTARQRAPETVWIRETP